MSTTGFLYSQIGYEPGDPMRALIRADHKDHLSENSEFVLEDKKQNVCKKGEIEYWGEKWDIHWWEIDFSGIKTPGKYRIKVIDNDEIVYSSEFFSVERNLLWRKTIKTVAFDQLETRSRLARGNNGWFDAGAEWREANSHATMLIGLTDMMDDGMNCLSPQERKKLVTQVIQGCDYLALCQDKAESVGYPAGSLIHEIPNQMVVIPGDQAKAAVALTRASRFLTDINREKSEEYLQRAIKLYEFILNDLKPYGQEGFSALNHGAPDNFRVPDEFMTRDLIMMMWAGMELWISGQMKYREEVIRLANKVMTRQISEEQSENDLYGHFKTFASCNFAEKANTHHHIGHDTGATFPHYVIPFMLMCDRWYDHPDVELWRKTVKDFAYGYFLPACEENPFYLLPVGYFKQEGLLEFCGPWHGINTTIGFAASLAVELEQFTGDGDFRKIAVGNTQWIAGLNAGITRESLKGCVVWKDDIEKGVARPYSQICGIGNNSVGCWTGIKGTIPNGFNVNPQFQLTVEPTVENDGPRLYTDEGWIPHAGGWVSALTKIRNAKYFEKRKQKYN